MMKKATQFLAVILAAACVSTTVLPQNVSAASWKKSPSGWWYQEDNGSYPKNQWKKISSKWYWFDTSGYMVTGWKKINGNWYYFQSDGAMLGRGWHKIGSHWYYMYKSGIMASNTWIGDDFVDANGIWFPEKIRYQEGWVKSGSRWWYRHADGSYTKNGWEKINGQHYLFDSNGYMLTGWQKVKGTWYYLQSSGAMMGKGWHQINGNWYYMYDSGAMATNTWIGNYYVNSSGVMEDQSKEVYLLDVVKPYITPYHYEECMSKSLKMGGTVYSKGFQCMGYGDKDLGNLTYFNLNGKYSQVSFTAGFLEDNGYHADKVTFRILADNKQVDCFTLQYGSLPVSRKVNINNCKQLVISVYSYQGVAFYDGRYGIAELKVR